VSYSDDVSDKETETVVNVGLNVSVNTEKSDCLWQYVPSSVNYFDSGPLFWKSTVPKVGYSESLLFSLTLRLTLTLTYPTLNPNVSTVVRIYTMDFQNSRPSE